MAGVQIAIALGNEAFDRATDQLRAGVAEQLLNLCVDQRYAAFHINDDHGVGRGFQQRSKLVFRLLAHAYVPYSTRNENAIRGTNRAETDFDRELGSIFA